MSRVAMATGPQVAGPERPTGAELRSVPDRVAVHSDLLRVIGVSAEAVKPRASAGTCGCFMVRFPPYL